MPSADKTAHAVKGSSACLSACNHLFSLPQSTCTRVQSLPDTATCVFNGSGQQLQNPRRLVEAQSRWCLLAQLDSSFVAF